MRYLYSFLTVTAPPYTETVNPILTATSKSIPVITAIFNYDGNNRNTIGVLNGVKMFDIPIGFQVGFQRMIPLRIDMDPGQVFSVGFTNDYASELTSRITLQYYLR